MATAGKERGNFQPVQQNDPAAAEARPSTGSIEGKLLIVYRVSPHVLFLTLLRLTSFNAFF